MWGIENVVSRLAVEPKPEPMPEPQAAAELPVETVARRSEQDQAAAQLRNKLEKVLAPLNVIFGQPFDTNDPSPEQIRQIASENAPIFVLPPGNLPADPQEYIAHSRLRENVPVHIEAPDLSFWDGSFDPTPIGAEDKPLGDNTDGDTGNNFTAADVGNVGDDHVFLDLDNAERGTLGREGAPVFYQFQPTEYGGNGEIKNPPRLTYHVFHAFNDGPTPLTSRTPIADHEGDWERVTYELNPTTFAPETAILSAHEDEHARVVGFETLKDNPIGRPLVYVAGGSHANYEKPGDYPLPATAKDRTVIDLNGDGAINEADGAMMFDAAGNLSEVTAQPWYPSEKSVQFGEISATENLGDIDPGLLASGPHGPSPDKGAVPLPPVFTAFAEYMDKTPQQFSDYFNSLPSDQASEFVERANLVGKDGDGNYYDHTTRYNSNGNSFIFGVATLVDLENWVNDNAPEL